MRCWLFLLIGILFTYDAFARQEQINLDKLENFSGLSKADILEKRKEAVSSSAVFSTLDYEPNNSVFQIEDYAPWISAYEISCNGVRNTKDISNGESSESLGILNPELLYYIHISSFAFAKKYGCSTKDYLVPYKVLYDKNYNKISAYIDYSAFYRKNNGFHTHILEDANARDLGFNYVYVEQANNIKFNNEPNLANSLTQTRGFYHLGGSCLKSGGCNNYSPYEPKYDFKLTDIPANLTFKLWKNQPKSIDEPADVTYEMFFY